VLELGCMVSFRAGLGSLVLTGLGLQQPLQQPVSSGLVALRPCRSLQGVVSLNWQGWTLSVINWTVC